MARRRTALRSAAGSLVLGGFLLTGNPAGAAELSLPTDTVVNGAPGSSVELGRVPVDTDLAGPQCRWEATVMNQDSTHAGNDIIVTSGTSELVLRDVEATEGKITTETGSAYLSEVIVVTLQLGQDGVFSGGLDLTIRYDQCTPATTQPIATSTTQAPTTQAPTTPTPTTPTPTTTLSVTSTTAGEVEPLGPVVTSTTVAPTTNGDLAPAGPVLPVTGGGRSLPLLIGGGGLIVVGVAGVLTTRRAVR